MRFAALRCASLLAAIVACAKPDAASTDTAAAAAAAATPASPAPLTAADVAGTWNGSTIAMGSDSVLRRWTTARTSDSTGHLVFEGARDSIDVTSRFDADSMISMSAPYRTPGSPGGPEVRFHSVGRLQGGRLVGTTNIVLASNPDSVLQRLRFEATRAP